MKNVKVIINFIVISSQTDITINMSGVMDRYYGFLTYDIHFTMIVFFIIKLQYQLVLGVNMVQTLDILFEVNKFYQLN